MTTTPQSRSLSLSCWAAMGSVRGSIIAAALLTVLPEMLRGLNDYRMLIYAVVLIAMMIFNQSPQMVAWRKPVCGEVPRTVCKKQGGGVRWPCWK